ncbi:MAG: T9SS type A sorting domain-containing protein [Candidatus Kapabacteria bacterium]|nr:T9SS type A sorting domain-containing protein [Candidatus Kapabacteria bacterium]
MIFLILSLGLISQEYAKVKTDISMHRNGLNDTLVPIVKIFSKCGTYRVNITELRDGKETDDPRQIDSGIELAPILLKDSNKTYNFNELTIDPSITFLPAEHRFDINLNVKNKNKSALATIFIQDVAGNDTTFTLRYIPENIELNPKICDFHSIKVDSTSEEYSIIIKNITDSLIKIKSIRTRDDLVFKIKSGNELDKNGEIPLAPNSSKIVKVIYKPRLDFELMPLKLDIDSLLVECQCTSFSSVLIGKGILLKDTISLDSLPIDFKFQEVNKMSYEKIIKINNTSSKDILFKDISLLNNQEFSITSGNKIDSLGEILKVNSTKLLKMTFKPTKIYLGTNQKLDSDTLILKTQNSRFAYFVTGKGFDKSNINDDNVKDFNIQISPNPIHNNSFKLNFSINNASIIKIEIINLLGQIISNPINEYKIPRNYELEIYTERFENGSYYVKISNDKNSIEKQIVIEK